jgi:hypothetical protein
MSGLLEENQRVPETEIKTWLTAEQMSPMGRQLMKIAQEIEESDETAMDEREIEQELRRRQGGFCLNDE